jgi:D-galactarolactone cycloisomerase
MIRSQKIVNKLKTNNKIVDNPTNVHVLYFQGKDCLKIVKYKKGLTILRISSIEAIPLFYPLNSDKYYGNARGLVQGRACTLLQVTTESGVIGYGESFGSPRIMVEIIEELKTHYIGKEPFEVPNLTSKLMNLFYHTASKGLMVSALSGLEMAGWDLVGKWAQQPVYKLLGGAARKEFLPYGSTGYITASKDDQELKDQVEQVLELGLQAIKIKIGTSIEEDVKRVQIVRSYHESLKIMVDMNGNYTADTAIRSIKELEPLKLYWVEEPVPPYDLDGFKKIKNSFGNIPIATGEAEYTRYGFRDIIQQRLVDIVQPDLCKCGGIFEAKAIAMMAQANNLRVSPHVWGGIVGRSAAAQFMASIPFYPHSLAEPEPMMFEYDLGENALRDELGTAPLKLENGWLKLQDRSGLGVELDVEKIDFYRMK